jgi:adenylylsulfate kinase-like enzyme
MILWITGISGSGKTTLGKHFYKQFIKKKKKYNISRWG